MIFRDGISLGLKITYTDMSEVVVGDVADCVVMMTLHFSEVDITQV